MTNNIVDITMRKRKLGEFFFGRHYFSWGIWQVDSVSENGCSGRFVKDVRTYEDAVKETWSLNGWGTPKYIKPCVY